MEDSTTSMNAPYKDIPAGRPKVVNTSKIESRRLVGGICEVYITIVNPEKGQIVARKSNYYKANKQINMATQLQQFRSKAQTAADAVNCPDVTVCIEMDTDKNTEYSVFFRKDLRHVYYGEGSNMDEAIHQALNDVNESLHGLLEEEEEL